MTLQGINGTLIKADLGIGQIAIINQKEIGYLFIDKFRQFGDFT